MRPTESSHRVARTGGLGKKRQKHIRPRSLWALRDEDIAYCCCCEGICPKPLRHSHHCCFSRNREQPLRSRATESIDRSTACPSTCPTPRRARLFAAALFIAYISQPGRALSFLTSANNSGSQNLARAGFELEDQHHYHYCSSTRNTYGTSSIRGYSYHQPYGAAAVHIPGIHTYSVQVPGTEVYTSKSFRFKETDSTTAIGVTYTRYTHGYYQVHQYHSLQ